MSRYLKIVYFLTVIFLISYYYGNENILSQKSNIVVDKPTTKKYDILHQNLSCPALTKEEWKVYQELIIPNAFVLPEERSTLSWRDMGLVTFTSENHMPEALLNCASILDHPQLKTLSFTIFFSSDVSENQTIIFKSSCPHAKIVKFPFEMFSGNVRIMEHYRFKALYQAMALKNHKVLLNFDTSVLINKNAQFEGFVEAHIQINPTDVTLLTSTYHNMFSATHPQMYNCFKNIDPEEMKTVPQFQSTLILWIGSEMGWKAMNRFVECSLQPNCIAPPGATIKCNIQQIAKSQNKFSGCHRFDQAVINLILYENSNKNPNLYGIISSMFTVSRQAIFIVSLYMIPIVNAERTNEK